MDLIYLMGGLGSRTKLGYPKQYYKLDGKLLFLFGLEIFCNIDEVDNIIIPTNLENQELILKNLKTYNLYKKNFEFCTNGSTRQLSVLNGLKKVKSKNVLISESVRPFISKELVETIINDSAENITPITQMVASVIDFESNIYNRSTIGPVQMPQKFNSEKLFKYHMNEFRKNIFNNTDDASLFAKYEKLKVIHGIEQNLKITTPFDIIIAKSILTAQKGSLD